MSSGLMSESEYHRDPIALPSDLSFTEYDVAMVFRKVARRWGMTGVRNPFLTHDPEFPVHFGITLNWRVMLNTAYLPKNIPVAQQMRWLEYGAIVHELGHYHWCPYDGASVMRYLLIIKTEWKDCTKDEAFGVLNYFSDIIVDWNVCKRFPVDGKWALDAWFQWNDQMCDATGMGHTISWRMMTRIFELLWYGSARPPLPDKDQERLCRVVFSKLHTHTPYDDILQLIVKEFQPYFIADLRKAQKVALSTLMDEIKAMSGGSGSDADGGDPTTDGTDPTKSPKKKSGKKKADPKSTSVDMHGKTVPFDMLIGTGDPFDQKVPSSIGDKDRTKEREEMLSALAVSCDTNGCSSSNPCAMMVDFGLSPSIFEARRAWFRTHARDLVRYESKREEFSADVKDYLVDFTWSDPLTDWDLMKSLNVNPLYPYPPFAKKWAVRSGTIGALDEQYREALIVIDSSGSMGTLTNMTFKSPFDFAVLSSFAVIHAVVHRNARFAVINFSDHVIATEWLTPTDQHVDEAERTLMRDINGGTTLPIDDVRHLVSQSQNCAVIYITDTDLYNWDEFMDYSKSIVSTHPIMLFAIGDASRMDTKRLDLLRSIGIQAVTVEKVGDLPNLVIGSSKQYW